MINQSECITLIAKLNLKLQSSDQVYVITVMHIYQWVKLTVSNTAAGAATKSWTNLKIKNDPQFTNCISEINNTQIDNAKNNDLVMPMYSLMECSDNYFKTSRCLWH